jgi:hypothetical protein
MRVRSAGRNLGTFHVIGSVVTSLRGCGERRFDGQVLLSPTTLRRGASCNCRRVWRAASLMACHSTDRVARTVRQR